MAFITLNPNNASKAVSLSGGNLTFTVTSNLSGSNSAGCWADTGAATTGKLYYEVTINALNSTSTGYGAFGVASYCTQGNIQNPGNTVDAIAYYATGANNVGINYNSGTHQAMPGAAVGNVVCVAVDVANHLFWVRINAGNWNNNVSANPATGVGGVSYTAFTDAGTMPFVGSNNTTDSFTFNFGATAFAQTVPTGFSGWSTTTYFAQSEVFGGSSTGLVNATRSVTNHSLTITAGQHGGDWASGPGQGAGKFYVEYTIVNMPTSNASWNGIGLVASDFTQFGLGAQQIGQAGSIRWDASGGCFANGSSLGTMPTYTNGDVLCMAWDLGAGLWWGRKNAGNWNNSPTANPATGTGGFSLSTCYYPLMPAFGSYDGLGQATINCGDSNFAQVVPSGFTAGFIANTSGTQALQGRIFATSNLSKTALGPVLSYFDVAVRSGLVSSTTTAPFRVDKFVIETLVRSLSATNVNYVEDAMVREALVSSPQDAGPIPIFPTLPFGFPIKLRPQQSTVVGKNKAEREMRFNKRVFPLWEIELLFEELREQTQNQTVFAQLSGFKQYQQLVQLWLSEHGQVGVFGFDAFWDDSRSNQFIANGDGSTYGFTIVRTWGIGTNAITEPIGLINVVNQVQINSVTVSPTQYFTARNKIYFIDNVGLPHPPGAGLPITMTFSFYYLCRFLDDNQNFIEFFKNRWNVQSLKFRSTYWP